MERGDVFPTNNFGDLTVIDYSGCFLVTVEFNNSGYQALTTADQVRKGTVKDRLEPTMCGVGYLGPAIPHDSHVYAVWSNMMRRCYDKLTQEKHPTYIGCTVCEEWHSYFCFYVWFFSNYIEGRELDKDKKIKGNKIYSPETCVFISKRENMQIAFQKEYVLTSPEGENISIKNLSEFCRVNNLHRPNMHYVISGKRNSHKGWKLPNYKRKIL